MKNLSKLVKAITNNDISLCKELIKQGFNINEKNHNGTTPFMHAIAANNFTITTLLFCAGADIRIRDYYGNNAVNYTDSFSDKRIINLLNHGGLNA